VKEKRERMSNFDAWVIGAHLEFIGYYENEFLLTKLYRCMACRHFVVEFDRPVHKCNFTTMPKDPRLMQKRLKLLK
jgi:hypothetical protein